jgi:hypothetical protein
MSNEEREALRGHSAILVRDTYLPFENGYVSVETTPLRRLREGKIHIYISLDNLPIINSIVVVNKETNEYLSTFDIQGKYIDICLDSRS